jgi:hypothetical protein
MVTHRRWLWPVNLALNGLWRRRLVYLDFRIFPKVEVTWSKVWGFKGSKKLALFVLPKPLHFRYHFPFIVTGGPLTAKWMLPKKLKSFYVVCKLFHVRSPKYCNS